MKTLNLIILLTGIALPLVIYLILKIAHYNPKISNSYTNRQKTIASQSNIKINNTDNSNTLTNALWTLLALFLVIWIGVFIARGVKKLREPRPKTQTEKISEPLYQNDYFLKKEEPIVILVENYYYGSEGYGKQYYSQAVYKTRIGPKNLVGGGLPCVDEGKGVVKIILSAYKEEGKITFFYSKDKSKIERLK